MAFELRTSISDPDSAHRSSAGTAGAVIQVNAGLAVADLRPPERRREVRYPTNDPAELEVLGTNIKHLSALVLDVSRSGLRLGIEIWIGQGAQLKITLTREVVIFGHVRYCCSAAAGFHAGVLITDVRRPQAPPAKDKP